MVHSERGHAHGCRRPGRQLAQGRAQSDPLGLRAPPGQRGEGIRAVRLSGPDGVVAQALGLGYQLHGVGRRPGAPVPELHADLHVLHGFLPETSWGNPSNPHQTSRSATRCPGGCAAQYRERDPDPPSSAYCILETYSSAYFSTSTSRAAIIVSGLSASSTSASIHGAHSRSVTPASSSFLYRSRSGKALTAR